MLSICEPGCDCNRFAKGDHNAGIRLKLFATIKLTETFIQVQRLALKHFKINTDFELIVSFLSIKNADWKTE